MVKKVKEHLSGMEGERKRVGEGERVVPERCWGVLRDVLERKIVGR